MAFFVLMIGNLFGLENTADKEILPESNKKETKGMKRSIDVSKRHFVNLTRINQKKAACHEILESRYGFNSGCD